MDTPPASTLSTPSPTELHDSDPVAAELQKAEMLKSAAQQNLKPIFLVVATTPCISTSRSGERVRRLGIGLDGELPWPSVKADMQYFKNVTQAGSKSGRAASSSHQLLSNVIMGRKTYLSIPTRFRPLDQRHNVIITRSAPSELIAIVRNDFDTQQRQASAALEKKFGGDWRLESAEITASASAIDRKKLKITQAEIDVQTLDDGAVSISATDSTIPPVTITNSIRAAVDSCDGQVSCIGGAEIYNAFLKDDELLPRLRMLQTEIEKLEADAYFECDTFWGEDLDNTVGDWVEADHDEVVSWTGVELPQSSGKWFDDTTAGVKLRVRGWRHRSAS